MKLKFAFFAVSAMTLSALAQAERLVTIDGSITEIVYALGAQDRLVGVDTTSIYPTAATELPDVGYMRTLSAEGILSLAPERIITTEDAGPADALEQLIAAGVQIDILDNEPSLAGLKHKIQATADALGMSNAGAALVATVDAEVQAAQQQLSESVGALNVMFVMDGGSRGFQVAGTGTLANGVLEVAGFNNVFGDIRGYKALTPEAAIEANPDAILVFHSQDDLATLAANPALRLTAAAENGHIYSVDDIDLLAFGPRLGWSLQQLAERLAEAS